MSSENEVCDLKGEMDDSGCVQDDSIQNGSPQINIMDMPDDVLFYILQYCTSRDLKALGYCCRRLCRLVQDKSLWRYVDATQEKCSRARLRWLIDNVLQRETQVLLLRGYARDEPGCLGFVNAMRLDFQSENDPSQSMTSWMEPVTSGGAKPRDEPEQSKGPMEHIAVQLTPTRTVAERKMFSPHDYWFRRCSGLPSWGDNEMGRSGPQDCIGPQFSLSEELLKDLRVKCPRLHTLELDYCNIDCTNTNLSFFPKSLKKLSLRGCRCYNMTMDKSFLFRINAHLPSLETLDVSECDWMDPATLLPLSKLPKLLHLSACRCAKMTEFVAYASLTARYGFRKLLSLDLRGSPVGDSEISALGWLPSLEKLWLSASKQPRSTSRPHAHFIDDPGATHIQLHDWEIEEPHVYQEKPENAYYYDGDGMVKLTNEGDREGIKRKPENKKAKGDGKSKKRRKCRNSDKGSYKRNRFFLLNLHKITEVIPDGEESDETDDVNAGTSKSNGKDDENGDDDHNDDDNESSDDETEEKENNNENNDESQHSSIEDKNRNDLEEPNEDNLDDCEIPLSIEMDDSSDSSNDGENANFPRPEIGESSKCLDDGEDSNSSSEVETGQCSYSIMKKPIDSDSSDDDEEDTDKKNEGNGPKAKRKSGYECIKLDGVLNFGEIRCGDRDEVIVFASAKPPKGKPASKQNGGHVRFRRNEKPVVINNNQNGGNQNDRRKLKRNHEVNQGASTSRGPETSEPKPKTSREDKPPEVQQPIDYRIEPRHHVLYVNVGPEVNTFRFPREFSAQDMPGIRGFNVHRRHIESSSLVTDFAIRRFGRADGEDVNIIHIGPNGPVVVGQDTGSRPDRSNLRFLSVNGYRNITDRSLVHLATAAPHLTHIDFTETNITDAGAENFRSLRPDCTLIHSKFP